MRLAERALGRVLRLPPATTDYTVDRSTAVPMRDGVTLLADHYAPATDAPAGTILVRAPYGRGLAASILYARVYASRGYHAVVQSTRGTYGSGGDFEPGMREVDDGADTVAWLREQPWFTGRFATVGLSYLGFTQWALLVDPPPELAAAVITVGPHDFGEAVWGSGAFTLSDFLSWSDLVANQEDPRRIRAAVKAATATRRLRPVLDDLPLGAAGRTLLGEGAPWYESWVENSDVAADFWHPARLDAALDQAQVPVLLVGGWQDIFIGQTLEQYRRLREAGVDVALTVGPWTHMQVTTKGARASTGESLDWIGHYLAGTPLRRPSRVRVYVNGCGWRNLAQWPPVSSEKGLYLRPGAALDDEPPPADGSPTRFTYDPAHPTPTVGGRLLSAAAGYRNDSRLAARPDVATFTGLPLENDLEIIGTPVVELAHTADNPYADVFVRISDVDEKGRSRNVTEGFVRLGPVAATPVRIQLDAVGHRFPARHRIRLLVAGGSHPRFARNLGTGEPPLTGSRFSPSTHVIAHGKGGTSRLMLPVTRREG